MQSKASTVEAYLESLPSDRRAALEAVRAVIRKNLDADYEEGMQYGMIGYYVPHRVFPPGYHCDPKQPLPFASLASQKNHMAIYLMGVYGDTGARQWFEDAWAKTGKKLDMGKSCVRFKKIEDLALDVIGGVIKRMPAKKYVEGYQATLAAMGKGRPAKAEAKAEKPAAKKAAAKAPAAKKAATKASAATITPERKAGRRAPTPAGPTTSRSSR
ncbi:DUF1801 domain-containing protein [Polyangium sp. 6x1]|uniref:DUF1801 domain-containing protein n=1 Tax=Polyangium sp. 6x1 TaxID=3042689 RepID=UPI00248277A1|nr:DUF1801 domain-containing protein [Polyangium sp. 6x1]MDI1447486.1 DUF1801 domain-containing protein [Polyangium sp. 6x1]